MACLSGTTDAMLPTLVLNDDARCQSVITRGYKKGEICGRDTSNTDVYCVTHRRVIYNEPSKERLPALIINKNRFLIPVKNIIIDNDFVICGMAVEVDFKKTIAPIIVSEAPPSEIPQDVLDWCHEMGLRYYTIVKSAAKR